LALCTADQATGGSECQCREQGWDSVGTKKYAESTPGRLTATAGGYMYVHS